MFWWVLGGASVAVAAMALLVLGAFFRADGELKRHSLFVEAVEAGLSGRDCRRPVVIGDPVEGNAWAYYRRIHALCAKADLNGDQIERLRHEARAQEIEDDPKEQARILELSRGVIGLLREGVRRETVDPGFCFRDSEYIRELNSIGFGCCTAVTLVVRHHHGGEDTEALDTAAVLLAAAQDLARNGSLEGVSEGLLAESAALDGCRGIFPSWSMTTAELQSFASRLDALDRTRDVVRDAWRINDARERRLLLETGPSDLIGGERIRPGWRSFWSMKIMKAQALNLCESGFRRLIQAADLEPYERYRVSQRVDFELRDHPNPLVYFLGFDSRAGMAYTQPGLQRHDVRNLSRRALLRIATALAWYESETGTAAPAVEALVPKYLLQVPQCAFTGRPFRYEPGKVWYEDPDEAAVWQVQRKR